MFEPAMQAMSTLKAPRNTHAHTHFVATNPVAIGHLAGREPNLLIIEAQKLHAGFSALESELLAVGFM